MNKLLMAAGLVGAVFLGLPAASAQGVTPQIAVPDYPGGSSNAGCFRIQGQVYGPYRVSFCLGDRSSNKTYRVTGGGLDCRGRLDWYTSGYGQMQVNLRWSNCGRGVRWSPDTMTCNVAAAPGPWPYNTPGGGAPQIAVPDRPPYAASLDCYYVPSEPGYPPSWVRANRVA